MLTRLVGRRPVSQARNDAALLQGIPSQRSRAGTLGEPAEGQLLVCTAPVEKTSAGSCCGAGTLRLLTPAAESGAPAVDFRYRQRKAQPPPGWAGSFPPQLHLVVVQGPPWSFPFLLTNPETLAGWSISEAARAQARWRNASGWRGRTVCEGWKGRVRRNKNGANRNTSLKLGEPTTTGSAFVPAACSAGYLGRRGKGDRTTQVRLSK